MTLLKVTVPAAPTMPLSSAESMSAREPIRAGNRLSIARPRVLLADDHTLVLEGLARMLESDYEIVGKVSDGRQLLDLAKRANPDVVLLDLMMPLMNGTEAGERLKRVVPNAKIIVVTMSENSDVAASVLRSWASGFLLKKSAAAELPKAIKTVMRGKTYVTPRFRGELLDTFVRGAARDRAKPLTPRQREVLQLLAEGHTMKEAANILHVAARTVAFHKYRMMEDLGLKNNSDLMRLAIKERLISSTFQ